MNGTVRDSERKQYSGLERRPASENLDSYQSYSKRNLGSRFTEDDLESQTCPPGETGRYLRQSSGMQSVDNLDGGRGYKNSSMREAAHNEDLLSNSSVDSQVVAKKVAPKKPERKKLKKAQETSSNMEHLIQEQIKLERELKQLQKIRENLAPPLDLGALNTNYMNGSASHDEYYPSEKRLSRSSSSSSEQNKRIPSSKSHKTSHSGHMISGPAHSTARPELTSGDSVDREVEGLLREVSLLKDNEDDTSPLKNNYLSPETTNVLHTHEPRRSSLGMVLNGYHSGVYDPNGYTRHSYSTPPQHNTQFVSVQRNDPAAHDVSLDKVQQFCMLKRQEIYWMNQIRSRRHILEQKLDTLVRQDVEEQYFYSQEELSRTEKAIADLFQSLSHQEVQWLLKNGMASSSPDYIRSPYNVHALQTNNHTSPSVPYNQFEPQFVPRQQQQHSPYPVAPAPSVNGTNAPQRLGYQPTNSQPHYTVNAPPLYPYGTENVLPGFQDSNTSRGNAPYQFQANTNASAMNFVKPYSTDKETQTFNGDQVQNGVNFGHRLNQNVETLESANLTRDRRDLGMRSQDFSRQRVENVSAASQLPEPGNSELGIEANYSQVAPGNHQSLERGGEAPVSHAVPKQRGEKTGEQLTQVSDNEDVHSNMQNRQKPAAVKQPSFDDHEVVKLKEKLEQEQRELQASLEREQIRFMEEQRRLKKEEERQDAWIRQQKMAEQENLQRMRQNLAQNVDGAQGGEQEWSADEVKKTIAI